MIAADIPNLISQIFMAYIGGVFLLAGAAIFFVGLLFIYDHFRSGSGYKIVNATIAGVRTVAKTFGNKTSNMYYAVFEYVGDRGEMVQAESLEGTSNLRSYILGTRIKIRLDNNRLGWATPINNNGLYISLFLIILAGGMITTVLHFISLSYVTYVVWGVVVLHLGNKFRKIITPKNLRETNEAFRTRILQRDNAERLSIPLLGKDTVLKEVKKMDGQQLATYPLAFIFSLTVMLGGLYLMNRETVFITNAATAEGSYSVGQNTNGKPTTMTFVTAREETIVAQDPWSHIFLPESTRNAVQVYYNPESPNEFVVARGLWQGALYKLMMGFGTFMLIQSLLSYRKLRQRMTRQ